MVCYEYNNPIHNTILNFDKLVSVFDIETSSPDSWECKDSKFCYHPAGHIITGNLKIISDTKICSIISNKDSLPTLTSQTVGKQLLKY